MTELAKHLKKLKACEGAMEWIGERTPQQAWDECDRTDWLFWWAGRTQVNSHQQIVLAACACARRALRFVPVGEDRPRLAIEAAEAWVANPSSHTAWAAWAAWAWAASAAGDASAAAAWASRASRAAEQRELAVLIRTILVCPWREVQK